MMVDETAPPAAAPAKNPNLAPTPPPTNAPAAPAPADNPMFTLYPAAR